MQTSPADPGCKCSSPSPSPVPTVSPGPQDFSAGVDPKGLHQPIVGASWGHRGGHVSVRVHVGTPAGLGVCVTPFSLSVCALCWFMGTLPSAKLPDDSDLVSWEQRLAQRPSPPPLPSARPARISLTLEKPTGGAQGWRRAPVSGTQAPRVPPAHCSTISSFVLIAQDGC